MKPSVRAIKFLESLIIPEGPLSGRPVTLAPFQKKFVKGALADNVNVAVLSIGRGNAKSALAAGIALGALLSRWDRQPRREILIAARTRDQGRIAFEFVVGFARSLPEEEQLQLRFRRSPRLEIEFEGDESNSGLMIWTPSRVWIAALRARSRPVWPPRSLDQGLCDPCRHWLRRRGDRRSSPFL